MNAWTNGLTGRFASKEPSRSFITEYQLWAERPSQEDKRPAIRPSNGGKSCGGRFAMDEIWKSIPGFGDHYQVSNAGRVRSVDFTVIEHGGKTRKHKGQILRYGNTRDGYLQVHLYMAGDQTVFLVHRLVLSVFVGPCPAGKEVNHKNGNKRDNQIENLEYVTRSENLIHSSRVLGVRRVHSRPICGEDHAEAKLTERKVREIRELSAKGIVQAALSAMFGVSTGHINRIINRRAWKHI
ncbi:MAG: HNH endonuclease [Planctomycetaceae bacterium]